MSVDDVALRRQYIWLFSDRMRAALKAEGVDVRDFEEEVEVLLSFAAIPEEVVDVVQEKLRRTFVGRSAIVAENLTRDIALARLATLLEKHRSVETAVREDAAAANRLRWDALRSGGGQAHGAVTYTVGTIEEGCYLCSGRL